MITTFLVAHPWLSPTALVVLAVAGWLAGPWLAERPRVAAVLAALSLVPLALLTLVPVDRELFARCVVGWALPTPGRVELMANVVLFVPPVYLTAVALRRPVLALVAGSAASALIEVVQALVPAIGRSCDTNDWLSNTVGAAAGCLLAVAALAWWRRRVQARPSGTNPDS